MLDAFELFVNRVAAFEAEERGEPALFVRAADVPGRGGERPNLWVLFGERADGFDLCVGACDGGLSAESVVLGLDPDGEELRVEPALAHAHGVEVRRLDARADVGPFVDDELHRVGVHVHGDGAALDGECFVVRSHVPVNVTPTEPRAVAGGCQFHHAGLTPQDVTRSLPLAVLFHFVYGASRASHALSTRANSSLQRSARVPGSVPSSTSEANFSSS